jgi:uncharacterized protein YfaQ (DUF2300 family)
MRSSPTAELTCAAQTPTSAKHAAHGRLSTVGSARSATSSITPFDRSRPMAVAAITVAGTCQDEAHDAAQQTTQRGDDEHHQRVDSSVRPMTLGSTEFSSKRLEAKTPRA